MAKMKFGPWVRPGQIKLERFEAFDATAFEGHPNWIKPHMIFTATNSARGLRVNYGKLYDGAPVTWVRKRIWCDPQDAGVMGVEGSESISLELNQDGSASIILMDMVQSEQGKIKIAAEDLHKVAEWFTKAVEANKL